MVNEFQKTIGMLVFGLFLIGCGVFLHSPVTATNYTVSVYGSPISESEYNTSDVLLSSNQSAEQRAIVDSSLGTNKTFEGGEVYSNKSLSELQNFNYIEVDNTVYKLSVATEKVSKYNMLTILLFMFGAIVTVVQIPTLAKMIYDIYQKEQ